MIMTTSNARAVLQEVGISVGDMIVRNESGYSCNGGPIQISKDLADRIVLRRNK